MKRISQIVRKTMETNIELKLNIDGNGRYQIQTEIGFLDHMLELFTKHGMFDLELKAKGDLKIDEHHLVEDVGIVFGQAFDRAFGERRGIKRYGFFILPMDEVITTCAVDLGGRFSLCLDCVFTREKVGDLPTELIYDFWEAFAQNAKCNIYIKAENGRNDHHKIESIFKAVARAMRTACEIDRRAENEIPSTKGVL